MNPWIYAAAAAAFLAAIGGIYGLGYKAGAAEIEAQWLHANEEAQEEQRQFRAAREDASRKSAALLAAAERRARDADDRYHQARAHVESLTLAPCPQEYRQSDGIRFTPAGVGLWDAPWTDAEGKPVFGDPGGIAEGAVDATTPLPTLEDAVDNHAENAQRCSENRRQLTALIALLRRLRAQGTKEAPTE